MGDSPDPKVSIGCTTRKAHDGLHTAVIDNSLRDRFEVLVDDEVIGWQPYRRYKNHIVLMGTQIDPQWRGGGVSSVLIDGVLELIASASRTVVPRCKLTGDYIFRHPQYRNLVTEQYQAMV